MSRQGSAQVVAEMARLGRQTSRVHSFASFGSAMDRTDAFRGFLGMFKDTYRAAHGDLVGCLEQAYRAAFDFEDAIAQARRDILEADEGVAETHRKLDIDVRNAAAGTGPGHTTPGWPDRHAGPLTAGNTLHSVLNNPELDEAIVNSHPRPPKHHAGHTPTKSPLSVLDAIQHGQSVGHHAHEHLDAQEDRDRMDDYLDRRGE